MYPDYTRIAIKRNEADAAIFASVGLGWLSGIAARKAERLRGNTSDANDKKQ